MFKKFVNKKGFSLIEVSMAIGFLSIVGLSAAEIMQSGQKDNLKLNLSRLALQSRQKIESQLKNPVAWNKTTSLNSSFSCFNSASGCSLNSAAGSNGFYPFVVHDADPDLAAAKKLSFDPTDLSSRISLTQEQCAAGTANPDKSCPLKFQAEWKPICPVPPGYPCMNAQIQIQVKLIYDFPFMVPLNTNRFDLSLLKNFKDDEIQSACVALGGIPNTVTGKCAPKYAGKTCLSTGQTNKTILNSVQTDGTFSCIPLYKGSCDPATQILIGITADGQPICDPRPANPASCTSGNVNCVGSFGPCSTTACGTTGTKIYMISTPKQGTGNDCPYFNNQSVSCSQPACTPTNCTGNYSACNPACGPGVSTFVVSTPATSGGTCNNPDMACNNGACGSPINCVGSWGSCNASTGLQTYVISTNASGGGASCAPYTDGQPRACDVDCVGSFGSCQGTTPNSYKLYSITTTKKNNGAACTYADGYTDLSSCNTPCKTVNWCDNGDVSTCSRYSNGTFKLLQNQPGYGNNTGTPGSPGPAGSCGLNGTPAQGTAVGKTCPASVPTCSFSGCARPACFVAGTKVKLANGKYQDIEKIKADDQVISYDEHTKKQRVDTVDYPTAHEAKWQILHHFKLANGTTFTSNEIHPFYVVEKGSYFEAQEIYKILQDKKSVSFLSDKNMAVKIISIKTEKKFVPVYNFEVRGISKHDDKYGKWGRGHNYYVHGILTHNKPAPDAVTGECPPGSINQSGACLFCASGAVQTNGCCVPLGGL